MNESEIFDSVQDAIADIAAGKLVIVTDDADRENEGDLIMAASKATPETVNMMIRYGSGIVCVPMLEAGLAPLGLGSMVARNREVYRTDFTVTVDAREGISTGISASDRTRTIRLLANPASTPDDFVQPGHVFPLRARPGGVLERAGHTEAAIDLAVLAGLPPSGVLCELVNDDGTVKRVPDLLKFKREFGLKMISIAQLIEHRLRFDCLVDEVSSAPFESAFGTFQAHVFKNRLDNRHHLALVHGEVGDGPALVRVHSQNLLTDVFKDARQATAGSIDEAIAAIVKNGSGVVLCMEPADCSAALVRRLSSGVDSGAMDLRDYGVGAQILRQLGLQRIQLLTNSQRRIVGLEAHGIEIEGTVGF
ncbi:3,4-dihydroxy-2-butanone-4-phosphate synthase [Actomonas aquatica]|uniref:3,4-dihydroxy-2-butanone 4-phosphate synthase n=1 Tax=Actomonas aquatica TaxID=2866162 RepID=A0ABZ1C9B9_9BACT|nr:3,4-dihydroxy-2-butanone-4-phosphate synthase [Opitutus sp. WL0086]WRQ88288.1 3,4-dihydroxy-2-butanone-4-phosphate synthase [Opitutus sp. WL0086]